MSLSTDTNCERISFFIEVIHDFATLRNYNGMAAVYFGIRKSVGASKKFIQSLPFASRVVYSNAKELFSKRSNSKQYREVLDESSVPCVPYMSLFFDDLMQILNDDLVDSTDGIIIFEKCRSFVALVDMLMKYQILYEIKPIPCIQKWLGAFKKEQALDFWAPLKTNWTAYVDRFVERVKSCGIEEPEDIKNETKVFGFLYLCYMEELMFFNEFLFIYIF
jgi:hypothetical protein